MEKSLILQIETSYQNFNNFLRLFRRLGFNEVIREDSNSESCSLSVYCRLLDCEMFLDKINQSISEYETMFDETMEYRSRLIDNIEPLLPLCLEFVKYSATFGDTLLYYDRTDFDRLNSEKAENKYFEVARNKPNKVVLDFKDNEFITTLSTYMDSYRSNLVVFDSLKISKTDTVCVIGENRENYKKILNSKYTDKVELFDIDDDTIYDQFKDSYDIVFISPNAFKKNIRDLIMYFSDKCRYIIVSGVYDLYESYYLDMMTGYDHHDIRTNRWCSYIIGKDFDSTLYSGTDGNGL